MADALIPGDIGGDAGGQAAYQVLARKYRPATFADLIGQDALVRTLTNAFRSGRISHAYMLSGVRGIGKTTTARILARALNCVGVDGRGGPTPEPCGVCPPCIAIARDRHVDVLELDAASRTGVDDIREIIDGVRYLPASARYKVYIIDEVHMLSKNAFNALLKTLEEPPPHVRFIFATTEIRKVPITVLSRCQRFDLRRVEQAALAAHLTAIALKENVAVEAEAIHMIARAGDGSVRDGLSLLDQAIAYGNGRVEAAAVRGMLGLSDRTQVFDLAESLFGGNVAQALDLASEQVTAGSEAETIVGDLLDLTHWLTRLKVAADAALATSVAEAERVRGRALAERLTVAELTRAWQMLLKGLAEVRTAPTPRHALDMVLIRFAFAADLPPLDRLLAGLASGTAAVPAPARATAPRPESAAAPARNVITPPDVSPAAVPAPPSPPAVMVPAAKPVLRSWADVVDLAAERGEALLHGHLMATVGLVRFETGRLLVHLEAGAPADLPQALSRLLSEATGETWLVAVSAEQGEAPLLGQRRAAEMERHAAAVGHLLVQAVLAAFPGAVIEDVRTRQRPADTDAGEAAETINDD